MKQDLDRLMAERGLDAIFVAGRLTGNPTLHYMTNGAKVIAAHIIQKRGQEPVFLCFPIEREEAAASGIKIITTNQYNYEGILREAPDQVAARIELYRRVFADLNISGKVGFYGNIDQGAAWKFLNTLDAQLEGITVFGESEPTLIDIARATKEASEAARIREVGRRCSTIFGETVEFLKSHAVKDNALVQADGTPLTIGRVHQEIFRFIAAQGLDAPEGIIFAIGRDAAIPHNNGNPKDIVELGKSLLFDFGICEARGGYYFDMTRTFCVGYAPPEVERAYQDVYDCISRLTGAYAAGQETRHYMQMACDFYESRGHPTLATNPRTESGFVHGLGHGIGLAVHEQPFFSLTPSQNTLLQPGHIFTSEPGLYYPDRGFGVRLEDVMWIESDSQVQNLCDFPKELVIPV